MVGSLGLIGALVAVSLGIIWLVAVFSVISIAAHVRTLHHDLEALSLEIQKVRYALVIAHDLREAPQPDGATALVKRP